MPTPFTSGSPSVANRWLHGAANVLWIGDSIGAALESCVFQVLRVTPAGLGVRGGDLIAPGTPGWFDLAPGGLGAVALLAERNYSPFAACEVVFNGTPVPSGGLPAPLEARFASDATAPYLAADRVDRTLAAFDWIGGAPAGARARVVLYRNADSADGVGRNSVRGSGTSAVARGVGPLLNLASATPAYLADDLALTGVLPAESIYLEAQSVDGVTPAAGSNFVICCTLVTSGRTGFTFIPASTDGCDVARWLDATVISDNALGGVLPLLGLTDVVISLGQNNTAGQTGAQFKASLLQLVERLRLATPGATIVFCPTYDTNDPATTPAPHLADFADAHYAAHLATPNSAFLNLYAAAGTFAQLDALGYLDGTGVNPTDAGALYVLQTLQGLLDTLLANDRVAAAGRYATQLDVEDLFGAANVTAWSQYEIAEGAANVARVQRALDRADATIDEYFGDGPYAVPLTAPGATLARWAATFAGVALYRSRPTGSGSGSGSPSLSVTASGPIAFSASAAGSPSTDAFAAQLAAVYAEMAKYKSGARHLPSARSSPTLLEAPSIVP